MGLLNWWPEPSSGYQRAQLGKIEDGVTFHLTHHPTCYRRGSWRLLVEVCAGENHILWGCFDDADQPMRYYHKEENAKNEAEAIAQVLLADRRKIELESDDARVNGDEE